RLQVDSSSVSTPLILFQQLPRQLDDDLIFSHGEESGPDIEFLVHWAQSIDSSRNVVLCCVGISTSVKRLRDDNPNPISLSDDITHSCLAASLQETFWFQLQPPA